MPALTNEPVRPSLAKPAFTPSPYDYFDARDRVHCWHRRLALPVPDVGRGRHLRIASL
jgi:hypothetical protein